MGRMMEKEFTVRMERLVYGGDALGRLPDGKAIFIPFCLPGELVHVRITEERQGHSKGQIIELLEPSPDRVVPLCGHYGICGGCHYQHLKYSSQLVVKENILRDQFLRIAGIPELPLTHCVPSPEPWNYRNNVQFHVTANGALAFHQNASRDLVPIKECYLPEKYLNDLWPILDIEPFPGLQRIDLRLGDDEDILVVLESDLSEPPHFELEMPLSAVFRSPIGETILAGDDFVWITIKDRLFKVSSASFFQVNNAQATAMVDHLLSSLPLHPETQLLDVYCGAGLFSAFLAPYVGRVVGVEVSPTACQDFFVNLDEFDNIDLYEGTAEMVLPALTLHPQVAIVDPPRSGVDRRALDALVALRPEWIAYISCDPATLCRDTKRLINFGYSLDKVTLFDLFPQTYHLESISLFHRS
jgi:23S rRNA (uracil1939-C5)-methyltransferase